MVNKKKILTSIFVIGVLAAGFFGGAKLFEVTSNDNFDFGKTKDKNALTEEQVYERNRELHKCIDTSAEAIEQLRKLVDNNIAAVNEKNCAGLLVDVDKDNIYDSSILGTGITSADTSVQMHYNFCSILYSNREPIVLTLTTDKLLEKFVVENEFGDRFVPTFNIKQSKDLKTGKFVVTESVGLVNLQDFLIK